MKDCFCFFSLNLLGLECLHLKTVCVPKWHVLGRLVLKTFSFFRCMSHIYVYVYIFLHIYKYIHIHILHICIYFKYVYLF